MSDEAHNPAALRIARVDELAKLFVHLIGHTTCVGYVIALTDGEVLSITCLVCGRTSFTRHDVTEKYCGACHVFHEDRLAEQLAALAPPGSGR